ncbi:hypothetical protein ACFQL1_13130 [Halomicroarcula sp. GCM10025709]|uniref:hypothetical protein n=1 Tax=Halomicroarcula sp. GCM10025709 TaxID=3252669 RepID=UPI0036130746
MSLQIGPVVSGAFDRLVSRTGAILLLSYAVLMLAIQSMVNTVFAALYRQAGFDAAVEVLPLVLDIPLGLAAGVSSSPACSRRISRSSPFGPSSPARGSFPADALTRNVPLAVLNLFVGGLVYGVLVFAGSLLLLVPGLFLYVALVFMVPYVAVEDRNFVAALRRSYALTAGNRIALFGLLVLLVAVGAVFGGMVGFGASLLLPAALAQLAITLVQAPVSLVSLAVISVAFRQLRDAETGDSRPGTPDDSGTAAAL